MKKTITALFFILISFASYATAELTISDAVDKTSVAVGEEILLTIDISGQSINIPSIEIPPLANFSIYSSGRSQSMSFVNGQISNSISFRYVLIPNSQGKFIIPQLNLKYDGKTYSTQNIEISVSASQKSSIASSSQGTIKATPQDTTLSDKAIFVKAITDKSSVYVNEQLTYYFKLYRRVDFLSQPQFVAPNFSGFWSESFPPTNNMTEINGRKYMLSELKFVLFPTSPGKIIIDPATLQCQIASNNPDDFFDGFFTMGKPTTLHTDPITINVYPLPQKDKPANFSGAVGQYEISAQSDKTNTKTNEPITLSIIVSGSGNIKTMPEPQMPQLNEFRKFDTASTYDINKAAGKFTGSKTFKTLLSPQSSGTKTIPAIEFSYFDPLSRNYKKIYTKPILINVAQGTIANTTANFSFTSKEVKLLNSDIRYIKDSFTPIKKYSLKNILLIINSSVFILLILSLIFSLRARALQQNVHLSRKLGATGKAKKYLKEASKLLDHNHSRFYSALNRALRNFVADKLNISADGLTTKEILTIFEKYKVPIELTDKAFELIAECDFACFAPFTPQKAQMQDALKSAQLIINSLEKFL